MPTSQFDPETIGQLEGFPLTDLQWAYVVGRDGNYQSGDVSSHIYMEISNSWDFDRFRQALNKTIAKHPMLRAVVRNRTEQVILPLPCEYEPEYEDLSALDEATQKERLAELREALSHEVLPVDTWPLFRFHVVRLTPDKNYIFISLDMIIADAVGWEIMTHDIKHFYEDPDYEGTEPEKDFKDYVYTMRDEKNSARYRKDKEYWQKEAQTMPLVPSLPFRTDGEGKKFRHMDRVLDPTCWKRIRDELNRLYILPTAFFAACYAKMLCKWSGQNAVTLNLPVSNRGRFKGYYYVIGDFTEVLLLPIELDPAEDFLTQIRSVQKKMMQVYKHASFGGMEVMREVNRVRGTQSAAFPIVFTSVLGEARESDTTDWFGKIEYMLSQTPQVYFDNQLGEQNGQLMLSVDYSEAMFEPEVAEKMFRDYQKLVFSMDPEQNILPDAIYQPDDALLDAIRQYNDTSADYPDTTLQAIVEQSLSANADRIALTDGSQHMTYAELDRLSRDYAAYLMKKGVCAGKTAAVLGTRTLDTIVRILAVIRTGAGYIPVNPGQPDDVVSYILSESGCAVYLDENTGKPDPADTMPACTKAAPDDTAYIIYTSGSTGVPKGVRISNKAVVNTLYDINERFSVNENDRILCVSSFGFDLSVYDIFGMLLAGGTVVLAAEPKDMKAVTTLAAQEQITLWNSVPAFMELAAIGFAAHPLNSLRAVLMSGDWISLSLPEKIRKINPDITIYSLGGATEAAIWSIGYEIRKVLPEWTSIPYGYPMHNQTCYVLDAAGNPCERGVQGEICIGGIGVADEYVKREEQTAKAFVMHPLFGRIYRTGDKGIFTKEGYIRILGRIDSTLKKNGYRIDTGQIEHVLEQHGSIQKAIADVRKINGTEQLIAYLLPEKEDLPALFDRTEAQTDDRSRAEQKLPAADALSSAVFAEMLKLALSCMEQTLSVLCDRNHLHGTMHADAICSGAKILPVYNKLIERWLRALAAEQKISRTDAGFDTDSLRLRNDPDAFAAYCRQINETFRTLAEQDATVRHATADYYIRCMTETADILTGAVKAVETLFQDGSYDVAENLYSENDTSRVLNSFLGETVRQFASRVQKPLRVLEVGGGTGGATDALVHALDAESEFVFTDISNYFCVNAEKKFADAPHFSTAILDLDQDAAAQGFAYESFDIVAAANVLHDTKDLHATLRNVRKLLKPGGLLLLQEVTQDTYFHMVTAELLEGYSAYNDFRVEEGSALLPPAKWLTVLQEADFAAALTLPERPDGFYGQHIITAYKPDTKEFLNDAELSEIRQFAAENLVSYMRPDLYVQLETLPLGNNQKINRALLPEIRQQQNAAHKEPETDTERKLCALYSELSGVKAFGVEDDFFLIGGDSLMMLKLLQMIQTEFACELSIVEFLSCGNLREIAARIDSKRKGRVTAE